MSKYLITGNAGLIGANLADYILTNTSDEVYGIDDLSGGYAENVHPNTEFYHMNLNSDELSDVFSEIKPDYVFHLAAYAAEGLSPFIRCFNYDNNLKCTANLINNCIKYNVKRLVFTSSMAVYGDSAAPFHEEMQPKPIDPYGVAKYACEMDIQIAGSQHDLDWCIIRPHNVYGRKQNIWDKYRNVLGIWMYQYINNMPLTIFGDGEQKRAFSYINDSIVPLLKAATEPAASKEIINLGGIHEYSINEACDALLSILDNGSKRHLEARHEAKYAYATYQKSIDILGFNHTTSLSDGLKDMWKWAKAQPPKERFVWPSYELDKNIYDYWKLQ
jgi:UDP-glucose 4-epimerase